VAEYSAVTNAAGIATFTFTPAYTRIDAITIKTGWIGEQYAGGGEITSARTLTGTQVQGMVSRGTLLLTTGPFQKAGSGITITIVVFGA
jgi:hypothetical protein